MPLPLLDKTGNFGWQPDIRTLASSASSDAVLNVHRDGIPLGHDTCSGMEHSPFLLFQASVDVELSQLSARIRSIEVDMTELRCTEPSASERTGGLVSRDISEKLKAIESRCDNEEKCMCRSNLPFFGIEDDSSDTWSSAENKVLEMCSERLGITIDLAKIERAHRMGKYSSGKC
ncbi:hypothetical protein HPB52_004510 [Rhipicephalus sanguineus]|uniref:Uncharacterized protein n=1 Tax=Rhipicephalus sanguineus TaxID=34632 RepID=A0A9D4Q5E0_RHISA|nr:hypothetical protein HPB52_004510 [Rhipicephalus sanguineus]